MLRADAARYAIFHAIMIDLRRAATLITLFSLAAAACYATPAVTF